MDYCKQIERLKDMAESLRSDQEEMLADMLLEAAGSIQLLSSQVDFANEPWIFTSDRMPTKEEIEENNMFIVTVESCYGKRSWVTAMTFDYDTVRKKEVGRWKWHGRLSPWEVIAWKHCPKPCVI